MLLLEQSQQTDNMTDILTCTIVFCILSYAKNTGFVGEQHDLDIKYTNDLAEREWNGNFSFSESTYCWCEIYFNDTSNNIEFNPVCTL